MRIALSKSPSWLIPISGMTNGRCSGPTRRPAIDIVFMGSVRMCRTKLRLVLPKEELCNLKVQLGIDIPERVHWIDHQWKNSLTEEIGSLDNHGWTGDINQIGRASCR